MSESVNVSVCVRPVMDWPFLQGDSLPLARDAGIGSSIPMTLHRTNGFIIIIINKWILSL